MTKLEKLIAKMTNNPKAVRFNDLVTVMDRYGWQLKEATGGGSHVKFRKPGTPSVVGVKPHGGRDYCAVELVEDCLRAIGEEV